MKTMLTALAAALLALAQAGVARAQDTGAVVLGWVANLQTVPIVVAFEKGFFKEAGLEVKSVRFVTGREALEALLGGQLDLGFMAEFPPTIGALRKQDFRIVCTLSDYSANRVIGRRDAGVNSIKSLEGKKIGTTLGSNANYFTEVVLKKAGIKASVVNVAPADIVPALVRGDIDAGVPFPDFYQKARTALGGNYWEEISQDYIARFVISASVDLIRKRPGDLKKFLAALIKADDYLHAHPAEAQELLARQMKGLAELADIQRLWPEAGYAVRLDKDLLELMADEGRWIAERGLIKDVQPEAALFRSYIDESALKTLDPARVTLP